MGAPDTAIAPAGSAIAPPGRGLARRLGGAPPTGGSAETALSVGPGVHAARAFGEVLAAAGDGSGIDAVLRPAAVAMAGLAGVGRCSVFLVGGRNGRFRGRLGHPRALDRPLRRLTMGGPSDALTADVLRTREPVMVADVTRDPRTARGAVRDLQVRSVLAVPMIHDGRVLGVAYLDDEGRRREPTAEQQATVLAFAALVAGWVDRSLRIIQLAVTRDELARERAALARVAAAEERFCEVRGGTVDEVLAVAAAVSRRPVELLSGAGVVLARAVPPDASSAVALGRDAARHLAATLADAPVGRARLVEPDLARGLTHRCVVVPLEPRPGERCLLALPETASHLGHVDQLLATRAGLAVEAAERRAPTSLASRTDVDVLLVAGLLGTPPTAAEAVAFAVRAGFDPEVSRVVAVVDRAPEPADPALLAAASAPWRASALRLDDGTVAVVVDLPPGIRGAAGAAAVRDDLVAVLTDLGADGTTVGVSTASASLHALPRALAQARALVRSAAPGTGDEDDGITAVTTYELGPARLLLTDAADARTFGEELLGALLDDDPSIRDLLATLGTFFASGVSVRTTALACGVHENTVRHRFGRVRALTGLDVVGESEDQLMARAALGALRLGGIRVPVATG